MSKIRIFYVLSLLLLAVLVVFTVFKPMVTGEKYSETERGGLLQTKDGWIIQFDIINHESQDNNYTIKAIVNNMPSTLVVSVRSQEAFTYIKHIQRDMWGDGVVGLTVYKEGEATPLEQMTYYLK